MGLLVMDNRNWLVVVSEALQEKPCATTLSE
jgi:hypothetical protein